MGYSFFKVFSYATAPITFLKAIISCVHAYLASIYLAEVDMRDRSKAAKEK